MRIIGTILSTVMYGAAALGLLFLFTNGTFSCSKGFFSQHYTCTATVVIPNK